MTDTFVRMRRIDGHLMRLGVDGHEGLAVAPPVRPMTEAEIEAAALSDPDARPIDPADLTPVPRVKVLRRAMALTQDEFAARFRIPIGTLRDWEQGRSEPDQPTRAYLRVIAADPEAVARALAPR